MQYSAPIQVTALVDFLQISTQSNILISAFNTIATVQITRGSYSDNLLVVLTQYFDEKFRPENYVISTCGLLDPVAPAGYYPTSYEYSAHHHKVWPRFPYPPAFEPNALAMVNGFYGGCTPLRAILASTFDCLTNIACVEKFGDYFPALKRVCVSLSFLSRKILCFLDQIELDKSSVDFATKTSSFERPSQDIVD